MGVSPSLPETNVQAATKKSKIIIGLAGQIYAEKTFDSLVKALDSVGWEMEGKSVEIHFWGHPAASHYRSRIVSKGYIGQDQLLAELANCDILYCPYWFEKEYREEAECSFPSKLTSYLNSGRPTFFHGPRNSSPGLLLAEKNAAICCFSTEVETILYYIRKALFSSEMSDILKNAKALVETELSEKQLHAGFKSFMNLRSGGDPENSSNHLN